VTFYNFKNDIVDLIALTGYLRKSDETGGFTPEGSPPGAFYNLVYWNRGINKVVYFRRDV
jgi:hypothetical protein